MRVLCHAGLLDSKKIKLPNRRQLFMHLKAAITDAEKSSSYVGVFFLDLDNFKNINDSMGHAFGDRVLGAIAERLRAKAGTAGFAARLGGDEFTIVCGGAMDVEGVSTIGWDLVRAYQRTLGGNRLLPVMASLPNHMASLLLTWPAATNTIRDTPPEEFTALRQAR
jgi:GGDEF domain-containing protein